MLNEERNPRFDWERQAKFETHEFGDYLKQLEKGGAFEKMNVRQTFQTVRGICLHNPFDKLEINYVGGIPPSAPNVYTDGGMAFPTNFHWSLLGAGIWWPKKTSVAHPLCANEFGLHAQCIFHR